MHLSTCTHKPVVDPLVLLDKNLMKLPELVKTDCARGLFLVMRSPYKLKVDRWPTECCKSQVPIN